MIKGLSSRAVLALAVVASVATGCSEKEPGDATSTNTGATTAGQTSKTTTSAPSTGGDALADFDACDTLNAVAGQVDLTEIEPDGDACDAVSSPTTSVSLKPQPDLKIDEAVGKEVSGIRVGSRDAKLVKAPASDTSCLVAIEVTPTDRVDIAASDDASLDKACDAATRVANAIEPTLPK
ncbi:hypothetical protein ACFFSW_33570 [Saccharothrix longispora]|uniref:DUF3558 domain-containing protein n=1 Tax=Saccharothrix longispora TaxID=33920 RepID=A0ABU1Q2G2_9PSEU|nr:hypothetical protein [Saccharothrix longispora]MDR6597075.1 hypothetical protein [Saccharothrix longispora]